MRWLLIGFLFLSSCTAYKHNLKTEDITSSELEKIEVDDKLLLVLKEELDEKTYLRGRFESFTDETILISNKRKGVKEITTIPLSNIRKIKFDENVPVTILKAVSGVSGTVFLVALISFLSDPNISVGGI
ncbi:hypothetical protein [Ekhidna sp.]|uniref:hypothetical protein n=1 Tax=Ekhidna sp. TaxID=2608089 RepID=UPI003BA8C61F